MPATSSLCRACGRPITPRRSHRGADEVRYCSKRCRARRVSPRDRELEVRLLALLDARAPGASLCPSEVARDVGGEAWRGRMEAVRCAARRLAAQGELLFLQNDQVVDAATASGPVRLRRPHAGERARGAGDRLDDAGGARRGSH